MLVKGQGIALRGNKEKMDEIKPVGPSSYGGEGDFDAFQEGYYPIAPTGSLGHTS